MLKEVDHVAKLNVILDIGGDAKVVGALAWSREERRSYFEFHRDFLEHPLPLSPFKLSVRPGVHPAPHAPFEGLHGLFNDSLPDEWGRKLLDRRLQKMNFDHRMLNPLDRLSLVGNRGMGALRYRPVGLFDEETGGDINLDWLASQAELVERDNPGASVERLQEIQGGSGGVRPKVLVGLNEATGQIVPDHNRVLPEGFRPWIVKFRSIHDPDEIGREEYAYSLMAHAAGVEMPATLLMTGENGNRYFAVSRFDRSVSGSNHVHTLSGLVEADHRLPSLNYDTLLKVTRLLTRDERHVLQMFRRMVFNVLARNRDDHAKNHAFVMDSTGAWRTSPAYDITFSAGPAGEHNMMIAGEGRSPGREHIFREAANVGVPEPETRLIYESVKAAVWEWPRFAEVAGLSDQRTADIDYVLNRRGPKPSEDVETTATSSP